MKSQFGEADFSKMLEDLRALNYFTTLIFLGVMVIVFILAVGLYLATQYAESANRYFASLPGKLGDQMKATVAQYAEAKTRQILDGASTLLPRCRGSPGSAVSTIASTFATAVGEGIAAAAAGKTKS